MHDDGDIFELGKRVREFADDALPRILLVRVLDLNVEAEDAKHAELQLGRSAWGIGGGADEDFEDDVAVEVEGVGLHGDQVGFLVDLATDAEEVEAHFGDGRGAEDAAHLGGRMVSEAMEGFVALVVDILDEWNVVIVEFACGDGLEGVVKEGVLVTRRAEDVAGFVVMNVERSIVLRDMNGVVADDEAVDHGSDFERHLK